MLFSYLFITPIRQHFSIKTQKRIKKHVCFMCVDFVFLRFVSMFFFVFLLNACYHIICHALVNKDCQWTEWHEWNDVQAKRSDKTVWQVRVLRYQVVISTNTSSWQTAAISRIGDRDLQLHYLASVRRRLRCRVANVSRLFFLCCSPTSDCPLFSCQITDECQVFSLRCCVGYLCIESGLFRPS